ncbi:MAG: response regulator RpfG family c-di-GMP phosphodiesterase [Bacteriovoracaceae bacterium]|jgi:response regulator RpfG family c-di-GMP phosphodiesterase
MTTSPLNTIVFIEDDILDYEVFYDILRNLLPSVDIQRFEELPENFYSEYDPTTTLVILDLNLRGIDGINLYNQKLKGKNYTTYVHTSSDNPSDITHCKDLGIYAYFQKKVGREEIKAQFQTMIQFYCSNLIKDYSIYTENEKYINQINDNEYEIGKLNQEVSDLKGNTLPSLSKTKRQF